MGVGSHNVVQAEGHLVAYIDFPRAIEHILDGLQELGIAAEGLAEPLVGDLVRTQVRIPGHTAVCIPVDLGHLMAAPVCIVTDVGDARNGAELVVPVLAFSNCSNGRTLAELIGISVKTFFPERMEIDHMLRVAEIFLGNLHFKHQVGLRSLAEQRADGLAGLEVDRTVLNLDKHVVAELAVEGNELIAGLHCAVFCLGVIDESPPEHHSTVRSESVC